MDIFYSSLGILWNYIILIFEGLRKFEKYSTESSKKFSPFLQLFHHSTMWLIKVPQPPAMQPEQSPSKKQRRISNWTSVPFAARRQASVMKHGPAPTLMLICLQIGRFEPMSQPLAAVCVERQIVWFHASNVKVQSAQKFSASVATVLRRRLRCVLVG